MLTSRRNRSRLFAGIGAISAMATATAVLATPAQATGEIEMANSETAVADSYLVVLKDGATGAGTRIGALADGLAERYDANVSKVFGSALNGFSIQASEAEAKRLAADGAVQSVSQNQRFHVADEQANPPSWGLDRVDQADLPLDQSYTYNTKADNVTAYVLDTGVDASHETFEGRASGGFDAIDNDDDPADEHGHGTHVAGTVGGAEYGIAKGVQIVPVRVLDAQGSGTTEQIVAGIDWMTQNAQGPSVANMSLGGPVDEALDEAVRGAVAGGVTFALAAGNESQDAANVSPARVEEAVTVAASTQDDGQASFSNFGSVVDLYAPGEDIVSASLGGGEESNSGTSMASPHVAGAAALYLADNPDADPAQVSEALTSSAAADKITNASPDTANLLLQTIGQ
ncbi:subtilase family protein [Tamaricihabitans halophyticus]|uniref:Subtilase family protein n=1 Tax=Tamaricihabitans halophyticus TaxID=1262583 RepID=A0A4R2QCU5_9PSEU|nr:S8 family peptidase [Tamaricihabitans halophyticus]TCP46852.1 subtilase family protein [Tamaricihabitans halophyticus]